MYVLLIDIGCEKIGHEAKFQGQDVKQDSVLDRPSIAES
jgi:hypothetical protein